MTSVDREALSNFGFSRDEIYRAEHAWFTLFSSTKDQNSRNAMTESDSPSEAWKTINDWFNPQTPGRESDIFSDPVDAGIPEDGDFLTLSCTHSRPKVIRRLRALFNYISSLKNEVRPGKQQYLT